jgi:hypothetical protein
MNDALTRRKVMQKYREKTGEYRGRVTHPQATPSQGLSVIARSWKGASEKILAHSAFRNQLC